MRPVSRGAPDDARVTVAVVPPHGRRIFQIRADSDLIEPRLFLDRGPVGRVILEDDQIDVSEDFQRRGYGTSPRVGERMGGSLPDSGFAMRKILGTRGLEPNRSAECGVRSAECGVRSAECGIRSPGFALRDSLSGIRSPEWIRSQPLRRRRPVRADSIHPGAEYRCGTRHPSPGLDNDGRCGGRGWPETPGHWCSLLG